MMRTVNKLKNRIKLLLSVSVLAVMVCSAVPVYAEGRTYDVVFKAGSHGTLETSDEKGLSSITFKQAYGEFTKAGDVGIKEEDGYYFTEWSPEVEDTVTKRTVYVAQYARLVDSVMYKVNYVDAEGSSVAAPKFQECNVGDSRTERAVTVTGYTADENVKTAVISSGNVEITFTYTANGPEVETVTETNTVTVPGPTTTNVVTQTGTPGTTTTPGAAATPGTTTAPEATTPETTAPTEEPGTTTIPDEEVPLAENPGGGEDNEDQDTTTIEDEEVPLADKELKKDNSKWIYSAIAGGGVLVLGAAALILARRRKM
ncbi:MucBP domain-containing protein [Lactonifactor longoviformis]|uniref:MucBP domain-containing protein n=1 Tax=Lactonifactor longoviformis DSM 17459 TaxID=1122155 RepID=A0A1M4VYG4_9CLOT|nr:MucBP domain-containing protein [Lactonifactor longoviformis]SHE73752.1 hypothetical protein SAMN02745158_01383 [Lactonifactor longoviformis DSM 17459]